MIQLRALHALVLLCLLSPSGFVLADSFDTAEEETSKVERFRDGLEELEVEKEEETDSMAALLIDLNRNRAAVEWHYRSDESLSEVPLLKTDWLAAHMRNGNSEVRHLIREGESLQRRLILATQSGQADNHVARLKEQSVQDRHPVHENEDVANLLQSIEVLDAQIRDEQADHDPNELHEERERLVEQLMEALLNFSQLKGSTQP